MKCFLLGSRLQLLMLGLHRTGPFMDWGRADGFQGGRNIILICVSTDDPMRVQWIVETHSYIEEVVKLNGLKDHDKVKCRD